MPKADTARLVAWSCHKRGPRQSKYQVVEKRSLLEARLRAGLGTPPEESAGDALGKSNTRGAPRFLVPWCRQKADSSLTAEPFLKPFRSLALPGLSSACQRPRHVANGPPGLHFSFAGERARTSRANFKENTLPLTPCSQTLPHITFGDRKGHGIKGLRQVWWPSWSRPLAGPGPLRVYA